jgi:hypothetical protein
VHAALDIWLEVYLSHGNLKLITIPLPSIECVQVVLFAIGSGREMLASSRIQKEIDHYCTKNPRWFFVLAQLWSTAKGRHCQSNDSNE